MLNKKDLLLVFILFLIGIFSRFPLREQMQSHWDGPQYSIAVVRYSLNQETPALPGYPLYIEIARFINIFRSDPYDAILILSVIGAGFGSGLFYLAGKLVFKEEVGIIAAILFLTGSTFYYFGLTAYPYGLVPFFTLLFIVPCYLIVIKRKNKSIFLGTAFALAVGFRPQEILFITPLFLYALIKLPKKEKIICLVSFTFVSLLWFIPIWKMVGGKNYITSILNNPPLSFKAVPGFNVTLLRIASGVFLSFGLASIFILHFVKIIMIQGIKLDKKKSQIYLFWSLWIIPSFLFNLVVRTDHAGHQMNYLSAFLLIISYLIYKLFKRNNFLLTIIVSAIAFFNLFWFFRDRDPYLLKPYTPTSFHYSEIKKNDLQVKSQINFIKSNFNPQETIVITNPFSWRIFMYYLTDYSVYDLDGLFTQEEMFKYIVRRGIHWSKQEIITPSLTFKIPTGIKYLVFVNKEVSMYVEAKDKKVYSLSGNVFVISIPVHTSEVYNYAYKSFKINDDL